MVLHQSAGRKLLPPGTSGKSSASEEGAVFVKALMEKVGKVEYFLVAVMIAIMAIVNFMQVVFRYVIEGSLPWSEELLRFLFVWSTFLGAGIGVRKGAHLGLTAIVDNLPLSLKKFVTFVNYGVCIAFSAIIGYLGLSIVSMQAEFNVRSSAMEIQMYWISMAIPVSFVLIILHIINIAMGYEDREKARIEQ